MTQKINFKIIIIVETEFFLQRRKERQNIYIKDLNQSTPSHLGLTLTSKSCHYIKSFEFLLFKQMSLERKVIHHHFSKTTEIEFN